VATGHYARLEQRDGRTVLLRGRDARKDQTYFLFSLGQEQLAHMMFPLGELQKSETREVARCENLKTAEKQESQEICFVPDKDYKKFLTTAGLVEEHRGEIVDTRGQVLGHHDGIEFYTIGQRKGLGISSPTPMYVIELDPENNRVVVGGEELLLRDEFRIDRCNWIAFDRLAEPIEASAAIRYNHPGTEATVIPGENGQATVKLREPQRAVTPGQACVFYQDDLVVGGGWIMRN
jgi:tRNA-specific 2-thiouridylase